MLGYVTFEKCRWVRSGEETICGGKFFCVYLPSKPQLRQIRKAARMMKKRGVKRAVFPAGYDAANWRRWGIEAVNGLAFRRRLLLQLLWWGTGEGKWVRAGICAQNADFWAQKAARYLAGKSRYLLLDCGEGTEVLSAALQREWGIAAVREPAASQFSACQILLLFAPREDIVCRGTVLPFYEGAKLPWKYRFRGIETCLAADSEQLGAALFEMGILREKDVEII